MWMVTIFCLSVVEIHDFRIVSCPNCGWSQFFTKLWRSTMWDRSCASSTFAPKSVACRTSLFSQLRCFDGCLSHADKGFFPGVFFYTQFSQRSRFGSTEPPSWVYKAVNQRQSWCPEIAERSQPQLLIGWCRCPTRWPRRPESRPLAELSIYSCVR